MLEDIGVEIKLVRVRQGIACDALQLFQGDKVPSNKKKEVFQGCAVWIEFRRY
jgi:hypothetical protein